MNALAARIARLESAAPGPPEDPALRRALDLVLRDPQALAVASRLQCDGPVATTPEARLRAVMQDPQALAVCRRLRIAGGARP